MSYRPGSTTLFGLLALTLGACTPAPPDRPIDTTTAYDCRQQAMAASHENWLVERGLYAECIRSHGYEIERR
jgi:hypothetical protein